MKREKSPREGSWKAILISEAIKHPRMASVPLVLAETGLAAIKGGGDMAGFVAGTAALSIAMSGLFRRAWWTYAYVAGAAGYLADQPVVPIVAGTAVVVDVFAHIGHTKTGLGEKDH